MSRIWFGQRRNAHHQRSTRSQLCVECLEDRSVPATFIVTTTDDVVSTSDGKLSLREAITRANERPGADVIVVPAGVYKIALGAADEDANAGGDLDVTDTLTITGRGASRTTVDGADLDRVFHVRGSAPSSIRVNFRGLTITNGQAFDGAGVLMGYADVVMSGCVVTANSAVWSGGGISNFSHPSTGNLTLIGSTVADNVSGGGDGGGVYLDGGTLRAQRSNVVHNMSGASGGGIAGTAVNLTDCKVNWNESVLWGGGVGGAAVTLTRCAVADNRAGGDGGGVYAETNATLIRSSVVRNLTARNGGGVFAPDGGEIWVSSSSIRLNLAKGTGGGIRATRAEFNRSIVSSNTATFAGGGIHVETANLTKSTVSGNLAGLGGGAISADSSATLTDCTVSGNAAFFGGGIYTFILTLTNSTVSDNSVQTDGGGVAAFKANLTNSVVSGNSADFGGGINASGTATLTNCTVSSNSAVQGGGIYTATANLTNSTVSGNTAVRRVTDNTPGNGGGIHAFTANLTNSTVSGNRADNDGGGVHAKQGALLNTTIAENTATDGGGLFREGTTGVFRVKNSLIAQNVAFNGANLFGVFSSEGYNLIGSADVGSGFSDGVGGDIVGSPAAPRDPLLGELRYNGGPTKTHALLAGSPAIDKGDNIVAPSTDQRGVTRRRDGDRNGTRIVDIGAFEK